MEISQVFGFLIIVFSILQLGTNILLISNCDNSAVTYSQCQNGSNGRVAVNQVVSVRPCQDPFHGSLALNAQPSDDCLLRGCRDGCLKTVKDCSTGGVTYSCESGRSISDIQPHIPFLYIPLLVLGILLLSGKILKSPTVHTLGSLIVFISGIWILGNSVGFEVSCDWSQETVSNCSDLSGSSTHLQECASFYDFSRVWAGMGPFALNIPVSDKCLAYGCPAKSCLKTVTPCDPTSQPTTSCTGGSIPHSTSYAAPISLFVAIGFMLSGFICCCMGLRRKNDYNQLEFH